MPHPNDIEPPDGGCPPDTEEPTEQELRDARDERKIEDFQWTYENNHYIHDY